MLRCRIRYRGLWMDLEISPDHVLVTTDPGEGEHVFLSLDGQEIEISHGMTRSIPRQSVQGSASNRVG
jgi:hypothetical protein